MGRRRSGYPARLTAVGLAVLASSVLAVSVQPAVAPAQDAPRPGPAPDVPLTAPPLPPSGDDLAHTVRDTVVQFVWHRGHPQMLHIRRAIVTVESQAGEAVRRLEARRANAPAQTSLAQGEVLEDAWWGLMHAELVDVPRGMETPLRNAVSARVEPLRCAALGHYVEAVRLSSRGSSVGRVAGDHLAEQGTTVLRACWARAAGPR